MTPISLLFVPASQPDRFVKASQSTAHAYIIDLEDTLSDSQKADGRSHILAYDQTSSKPFWVRINGATSTHFEQDLACLQTCRHLAGVVLPKTETKADIERITLDKPIIAVIETPIGMANVPTLATANGLLALGFGGLDLGEKLGVVQGSGGAMVLFDRLRADLVLHSAINGLAPPIETIFANFKDSDNLAKAARHAFEMGFGGQFAIHPAQADIINTAYTPHPITQDFAQKVLDYHQNTGEMVFVIDGQMVDLPVITWAKKQLGVD